MKATVLTNIFNEEYLLPFWLEHHKKIFDHGIIIDYWSTDKSVEICKKICPTWEVRTTKNPFFGAIEIDNEFMEIEKSIEGVKTILNTTEFLFMNKPFPEIFLKNPLSLSIEMYGPYTKAEKNPNTLEELFKGLLEDDVRFQLQSYRGRRQLHNYPTGNYGIGRHSTKNPSIQTTNAVIIWLGYYPWNEKSIQRKLQIKTHIPQSDLKKGYSFHHFFSLEKFNNEHNTRYLQSKPLEECCKHIPIRDFILNYI
jgi:hypothetical protein